MAAKIVYIFANPYSGSGENKRYVAELIGALEKCGVKGEAVWDLHERKAILSDRKLGERCETVVSAGGDGSLGDVVNELAVGENLGDVNVAMLPMGNENLFAREFGFTREAGAMAEAIAKGDCVRVDMGWVMHRTNIGKDEQSKKGDGKYFTLVLSAGFDAEVIHALDLWRRVKSDRGEEKKKRVTRLSYVPIVLKTVWRYGWPRIELLPEEGGVVRGCCAFVFVLKQYAAGLPIAGEVVADDGMVDWVVLEKGGVLQMLRYVWWIWRDVHIGKPGVSYGRSRRLVLRVCEGDSVRREVTAGQKVDERRVAVEIDGDVGGFLPVEVEAERRVLRVLAMGSS
ncbi:Diacylglycerol kinase [Poriferisphaera corsica]|uniref:Diacylglycerol kinase n=1 Tax=Poriferisphaera corsica TaxID=2528020 RepID=A0A517YQI5_9BACT|nr:diacylglycerol kinase family protein [Poriferisphaera corsica]QDU32480.1 Diacylglycerol kinase [Poriferisphaera corsica]